MSVNKNSIGVIDVKVVKTVEFLSDFIGQKLTVWGSGLDGLYCIEEFRELRFTKKNYIFRGEGIVLMGSNSCNTFAVECNRGFGFTVQNSDRSYWIDKVNEEDAVVIIYERENLEE